MAPVASAVTRVLITGFGPFQGVPDNPSWGIASRLPSVLPNNISLTIHPSAVPVAYHPVASLVPGLYAAVEPDIALHIGVAAGRSYFAVEQTSSKDVYEHATDVEGRDWTDAEGDAAWPDEPATLSTDLALHDVVDEWARRTAEKNITWPSSLSASAAALAKVRAEDGVDVRGGEGNVMDVLGEGAPGEPDGVRWSDAVGTYLCAFIYYTGLVEMGRREVERRDTAFMHVPLLEGDEEVGMGVDVTVELVQALVKSWREQREEEGEEQKRK